MKLGIVGLPNVGKSTLFNAITQAGAESANYPFCTIDPNVGMVAVPDERLQPLAEKVLTPLLNSLNGDSAVTDDEKRLRLMKQLVADGEEEVPKCVFEKEEEVMDEAKAKQVMRSMLDGIKLEGTSAETPATPFNMEKEEEEEEEEEVNFDVDGFRGRCAAV